MSRKSENGCAVLIAEVVGAVLVGLIGWGIVSAFCPDECEVDYNAIWDTYQCNCVEDEDE